MEIALIEDDDLTRQRMTSLLHQSIARGPNDAVSGAA